MKPINIVLGLFVLILITALITNPSKDEFVDYVEIEFVNQSNGEGEKLIRSLTQGIIGTVADKAKRNNYLVFSTYELGEHTYIGVFGQFIVSNSEKSNLGLLKNT